MEIFYVGLGLANGASQIVAVLLQKFEFLFARHLVKG